MNLSMGPEREDITTVPVCTSSLAGCRRLNFESRRGMALISDDSVNSICSLVSLWYFKTVFLDSPANYFAGSLIKSCHRGICYLGKWLLDISQIAKKKGVRVNIYAYKERCKR